MATKKKAAPKKAVRKVVKKAPAKKATKKVVKKRAYNRKPKPEAVPVTEQAMQADQAQSNASVLREIEAIDLRGLDSKARFGVFYMLDSEGYITSTVESLLKLDNLLVGLEADTLMLNHQNKLVRPATWEEVGASSACVSRPIIHLNVQIGFSRPEPAYQDVLQIGDAQYVRIA